VKFVLFAAQSAPARYGVLVPDGVIAMDELLVGADPQERLRYLVDEIDTLRADIEELAAGGSPVPLDDVRLLAPVPRPGKILCTTAVYGADAALEAPPLLATLKSAEAVVDPGQTVHLPEVDASWQFVPQAGLGLVIRGPAKKITAENWRTAVFGYTCAIDVMAHGDQQFGRDFWLAKADTLGPLGPCIVTIDEVPDPGVLHVRSWQNRVPAQDFRVADASVSVPHQVELVTTVMTLHSADVLVCGTSPTGPRPLADADDVEVEIEPIGRLAVRVAAVARSGA